MAGRPLRNAMIDVLRKRTAEWFGDDLHTALDYAVEWIENGRTIQQLIYDMVRDLDADKTYGLPTPTPMLSRTMLMHYLDSLSPESGTVANRLLRARSIGAHAMVEAGNVALDATPADKLDRDTLNVLDRRLAAKERLAAAWNRNDFGKAAPVVSLNFGDLHLAALQHQARIVAQVSAGDEETDVPDATWQLESGEIEQEVGQEDGTQIATVGKKP